MTIALACVLHFFAERKCNTQAEAMVIYDESNCYLHVDVFQDLQFFDGDLPYSRLRNRNVLARTVTGL